MRNTLKSYIIGLTLAATLFAGATVFGQEATKSITLNRDGKINGQVLSKGSYTLKFDESKGGDLQFLKGKKEVVKAPYDLMPLNKTPEDTVVVFKIADDGSLQVSRIEFKGNKTAIVIK